MAACVSCETINQYTHSLVTLSSGLRDLYKELDGFLLTVHHPLFTLLEYLINEYDDVGRSFD